MLSAVGYSLSSVFECYPIWFTGFCFLSSCIAIDIWNYPLVFMTLDIKGRVRLSSSCLGKLKNNDLLGDLTIYWVEMASGVMVSGGSLGFTRYCKVNILPQGIHWGYSEEWIFTTLVMNGIGEVLFLPFFLFIIQIYYYSQLGFGLLTIEALGAEGLTIKILLQSFRSFLSSVFCHRYLSQLVFLTSAIKELVDHLIT